MREPDRIVRLKTVLARTGLSRSTYRKIAEGTFPTQIKISVNCESTGRAMRLFLKFFQSHFCLFTAYDPLFTKPWRGAPNRPNGLVAGSSPARAHHASPFAQCVAQPRKIKDEACPAKLE